ncbi:hypothetical protein CPC08DRAFT_712162 [Agrocybe pediades]|nr:hypothetical protein CPC08DRAFT_712162 [Agrocybe pediades]
MSSSTSHDLSKYAETQLQGPINFDVLWRILQLLSDPEEPDEETRFKAVHNIAQVCRTWRTFTLDCASIWARMVNLNVLSKSSEQWREEFMRRTGNAPLSIYGTLATWTSDWESRPHHVFFLSLIAQLHRIRIFRVVIQAGTSFLTNAWEILWTSPAPILEEFDLHAKDGFAIYPPKVSGVRLFKDHAPRLRLFSWPKLVFSYNVSWAPQLTLTNVIIHPVFTAHQALKILQRFPGARTLTYDRAPGHKNGEDASASPPLSSLNLPHLSRINFRGSPHGCLSMLSHITPSPSCSLAASIYGSSNENPFNYDLESFLMPYIRSAFLAEEYLDMNKSLSMSFGSQITSFVLKHNEASLLSIDFTGASTELQMRYLTIISSFPLCSIEKLHLLTLPKNELAFSGLRRLVSNLSSASLKELSITGRVLACLNMLSTEEIAPLSRLEHIELQSGIRELHFGDVIQNLVSLLRRLQAVWKKPVVLDVTQYYRHKTLLRCDWRPLDEFQGLTVVFKGHFLGRVYQYICGTGHPEMLARYQCRA